MGEVRARVTVQEKGLYTLSYEGRELLAEVSGKFRHQATCASDFPAVGDYVVASWPTDGSHAIISALFPRRSVFVRKAAGTGNEEQVVAANIDVVFICMSLNQDFNLRRLERYLVVAMDSGATPVVVLTKADLADDAARKVVEVQQVAFGVDVVVTSAKEGDLDAIRALMEPGRTYAFLGSSGVGKSTLINGLAGAEVLKTAKIREDDDKGRHTTTHRQLMELPDGACVIDTPGMRELGLWNNEAGVEGVFSDVEELIAGCRFADCGHTTEPGCKVRVALQDGSLTPERWRSYCKLQVENAFAAGQSDYLRAKEAKFKDIAKQNRRSR